MLPPRPRKVGVHPSGSTVFTWTLSRAHATESDFVSWTSPPFEALYAATAELPNRENIDPMLMIFPPPSS